MVSETNKHGSDNEGKENSTGYNQAVPGLCEMTEEYDRMFTAEGKFWFKFKQDNPGLWKYQLERFKCTRGTIFMERLIKYIKWLNR